MHICKRKVTVFSFQNNQSSRHCDCTPPPTYLLTYHTYHPQADQNTQTNRDWSRLETDKVERPAYNRNPSAAGTGYRRIRRAQGLLYTGPT